MSLIRNKVFSWNYRYAFFTTRYYNMGVTLGVLENIPPGLNSTFICGSFICSRLLQASYQTLALERMLFI